MTTGLALRELIEQRKRKTKATEKDTLCATYARNGTHYSGNCEHVDTHHANCHDGA